MTKRTLVGLLTGKNSTEEAAEETGAAEATKDRSKEGSSAAEDTTETESGDDPADDESDDDEPSSEDESAGSSNPTASGEKTLEDYRAAFGHSQGSVYFVDKVPFEDACAQHLAEQQKVIASKDEEIAKLTAENKALVEGQAEAEPVGTQPENSTPENQDAVGAFAASLKIGDSEK